MEPEATCLKHGHGFLTTSAMAEEPDDCQLVNAAWSLYGSWAWPAHLPDLTTVASTRAHVRRQVAAGWRRDAGSGFGVFLRLTQSSIRQI